MNNSAIFKVIAYIHILGSYLPNFKSIDKTLCKLSSRHGPHNDLRQNHVFGHVTSLIGRNVRTPYWEKFSRVLYICVKYEKNLPHSIEVIVKTKWRYDRLASPTYKQVLGHLMIIIKNLCLSTNFTRLVKST